RTRGRPDRDAQLVRDHRRQRGLAQSRRAVEQDVIERFAALPGGGNRHLQVLAHPVLPDVLVERARTKPRFVLDVLLVPRCAYQAIVHAVTGPSSHAARRGGDPRTTRRAIVSTWRRSPSRRSAVDSREW